MPAAVICLLAVVMVGMFYGLAVYGRLDAGNAC